MVKKSNYKKQFVVDKENLPAVLFSILVMSAFIFFLGFNISEEKTTERLTEEDTNSYLSIDETDYKTFIYSQNEKIIFDLYQRENYYGIAYRDFRNNTLMGLTFLIDIDDNYSEFTIRNFTCLNNKYSDDMILLDDSLKCNKVYDSNIGGIKEW